MFCLNCGNKLPDDAKWCNKCGTAVGETQAPESPATAASEDVSTQTSKPSANTAAATQGGTPSTNTTTGTQAKAAENKKKGSVFSSIIVMAVVFFIAFFASKSCTETFTKEEQPDDPNPAYNSIFEGTDIYHSPIGSAQCLKDRCFKTSFAKKSYDNGVSYIEVWDYTYKDDVIHTATNTTYTSVAQLSESERNELLQQLRAKYALMLVGDATVSLYGDYVELSIKIEGLENEFTRSQAQSQGLIVGEDSKNGFSMKKTRNSMKNDGYEEKYK